MRKILIIDDEISIRRVLKLNLEAHGFEVTEASSGTEGVQLMARERPHAIVLDLGLPDKPGLQVLSEIRSWSKVPILVLTVRDEEGTKVNLLEAGADDYMTKPFSVPELIARINVSLRHHPEDGAASPIFESGDLKVDLLARRVFVNQSEVHLTNTEFNFLRLLIRHAGRVVSQETILSEIWGRAALENSHYVRIYVGQLRKKIESEPSKPRHLLTEPGIGYRIQ